MTNFVAVGSRSIASNRSSASAAVSRMQRVVRVPSGRTPTKRNVVGECKKPLCWRPGGRIVRGGNRAIVHAGVAE